MLNIDCSFLYKAKGFIEQNLILTLIFRGWNIFQQYILNNNDNNIKYIKHIFLIRIKYYNLYILLNII